MSLTRIIFVDDDALVLGALRNCLRRYRKEWEMRFVASGEAALTELAASPADVVVTDMRMPGMQGQTLLHELREKYPSVLRLVLSGQASRDAVVEGMRVAHQYMSKPCPMEELYAVVQQLRTLQQHFNNPGLQRAIQSIDRLPTPSGIYRELQSALGNPDVGLKAVGHIVERDPALAARLLQLSNSAYYGRSTPVAQVAQALNRVGLDVLNALVTSSRLFSSVEQTLGNDHRAMVEQVQQRSLDVARTAQLLLDGEGAHHAYLAALLQDVGGLVLLSSFPEHREQLFGQKLWPSQRAIIEKEVLGFTHAEVGAYLLGTWGLPPALTQAVARQHAPIAAPGSQLDVPGAVYLAQRLVMAQQKAFDRADLDQTWLSNVGLTLQKIDQRLARGNGAVQAA